jgi:hypothetical protein
LLIVGFFALDLFPYGGFTFAILLTIAFLNTNMLVYKKQISESFSGNMRNPINPATYEPSNREDEPNQYVRNDDDNLMEPMGNEGMDNSLVESFPRRYRELHNMNANVK